MSIALVVSDGIEDAAHPSGGNRYDRELARALVAGGWDVRVATVSELGGALAASDVALVDGLVLAAAGPALVQRGIRIVPLLHMAPHVDATTFRMLGAASAIVTTSAWTAERLRDLLPALAAPVTVARPGVAEPAALARTSARGIRLRCVATLAPHKGQDVLLDALGLLRDLDWTLELVGADDVDPAYTTRLRERLLTLGLAPRVHIAGARSASTVDGLYDGADLVIVPSRSESYGMAAAEAVACGIPVLASDVGGVREALPSRDGRRAGLLVPPDAPAALAAALRRWLTDAALRAELTATARAQSAGRHGWERTAADVAEALEGIGVRRDIAGPGSGSASGPPTAPDESGPLVGAAAPARSSSSAGTARTRRRLARWMPLLGALATAAVLGALVARLGGGPFVQGLSRLTPAAVIAALGLTTLATLAASWRWTTIARALGSPLTMRAAVPAYYRSQLLNSVLPGGVLGDVERGLVARRAGPGASAHAGPNSHSTVGPDSGPDRALASDGRASGTTGADRVAPRRSRALAAVAWDRGVGQAVQLAVLVIIAAASPTLPAAVRVAALGLAVAAAALVGALLVLGRRPAAGGKPGHPGRARRIARAFRADVGAVLAHPGVAVRVVAASAVVVGAHVAVFALAAVVAGAPADLLRLLPLALAVQAATAIPLNVAGWGPREGVAAAAFAGAGLGAGLGLAASVAYGALALIAVLPGIAVLLAARLRRRRAGAGAGSGADTTASATVRPRTRRHRDLEEATA